LTVSIFIYESEGQPALNNRGGDENQYDQEKTILSLFPDSEFLKKEKENNLIRNKLLNYEIINFSTVQLSFQHSCGTNFTGWNFSVQF
jgi:hypothetical protein